MAKIGEPTSLDVINQQDFDTLRPEKPGINVGSGRLVSIRAWIAELPYIGAKLGGEVAGAADRHRLTVASAISIPLWTLLGLSARRIRCW